MDVPAELSTPQVMQEIERIELPEFTDEVWHDNLPDARPGTIYGYRVHGPDEPEHRHRFNPNKLLLDPYAKAVSTISTWQSRVSLDRGPQQWPTI